MQILLLSMPDSLRAHAHRSRCGCPMARLRRWLATSTRITSVAIADLILAQSSVQATVTQADARSCSRTSIGLSVMTFQRSTARRIISLVKSMKPDALVVVGGYDPSLAPEAWTHPALGVDFIVRGEGDLTFRESAARARRTAAAVDDCRAVVSTRGRLPAESAAAGHVAGSR